MKVISYKNMPAKIPLFKGLTLALALDHWNATQWVWAVSGTLFGLIVLAALSRMSDQKQEDIFEKEKE